MFFGRITAGTLLGIAQVSGNIANPILQIMQSMPKIKGTKLVVDRLIKFSNYKDENFGETILPQFNKHVKINNLEFSYNEDEEAIKKLNLTIRKNNKYVIIGKSGCGKTTLIKLLMGYYSNFKGEILYDSNNLMEIDVNKLNEMFGVIHQNIYMFDESIKDNICLQNEVDSNELTKALDMSGVNMNLSRGQRQRVAVARAIVQKKPILILDEGTSAIDMQTAYDIESRLLEINDLTLFTITHNLNSELLRKYDEVIFMEEGKIVEKGVFDDLISSKGKFADFYELKRE